VTTVALNFFSSIIPDTVASSASDSTVIEKRVRDLEAAVRSASEAAQLPPDQQKELVAIIGKKVQEDFTTEVVKAELAKIQEGQKEAAKRDQFLFWSEQTTRRITQQIAALGSRANINLFIGLVLAISGIVFLIIYVQTSLVDEGTQFTTFVIHFLPRLSLVTIIELFSYFFLNLYKQAIDEIKYFQNEITNIDMKMIAASMTLQLSPANPASIITALSGTERNFLIPKDQRIVAEATEFNMQTASQRIIDVVKDIVAKSSTEEKKP
jgi:hypothetical protein